jgi:hypothetical protein
MTQPDESDTSRAFGSRALSAADQWASRPVRLEHGSDSELRGAGDTHRRVRQSATGQDDAAEDARQPS